MITFTDSVYVCDDCLMWLVNGDATGLDHYLSGSEAEEKLNNMIHGERYIRETKGYIYAVNNVREFDTSPCDCCGESLHGRRHEMNI